MKRAREMVESSEALKAALGMELGDLRIASDPTLSAITWRARVDNLEKALLGAWRHNGDGSLELTLSVGVLASMTSVYQNLQNTRSALVPLTVEDWLRWKAVLAELESVVRKYGGASQDIAGALHVYRSIAERRASVFLWGSLAAGNEQHRAHEALLRAKEDRLSTVVNHSLRSYSPDIRRDDGNKAANTPEQKDDEKGSHGASGGVASVLTACFREVLEAHGRAVYDAGAEYMPAPSIEAAFRESFLEPLLVALEDAVLGTRDGPVTSSDVNTVSRSHCSGMRTVVEGWMRGSFKREALLSRYASEQDVLEAYEAFEVDDKRTAAFRSFLRDARGERCVQWRRIAEALSKHTLLCVTKPNERYLPETTAETSRLVAALSGAWRDLRSPNGAPRPVTPSSYQVFFLLMRKLLDLDQFPGALTDGTLEKMLSPLHTWLVDYLGVQHRFSWEYPFPDDRDASLWAFLLERHHVLLVHSLAAARTQLTESDGAQADRTWHRPSMKSVAEKLSVYEDMLASIRTVVLSVLHAWQTHLSILFSSECIVKPAKKALRARESTQQVRAWLRDTIATCIAKGFMADLSDLCDNVSLGPAESTTALVVEAKLKMNICDAQMCVATAMWHTGASDARLETYRQDLSECQSRLMMVSEALIELATEILCASTPSDASLVMVPLLGTGAQLLGHLSTLRAEVVLSTAAPGSHSVHAHGRDAACDRDFSHNLHRQHKELLRVLTTAAGRHPGEVAISLLREQILAGVTRLFATYPPILGVAHAVVDSAAPHVVPCTPMYADARNVSKVGCIRGRIPLGGFMDVACEALTGKWIGGKENVAGCAKEERPRVEHGM